MNSGTAVDAQSSLIMTGAYGSTVATFGPGGANATTRPNLAPPSIVTASGAIASDAFIVKARARASAPAAATAAAASGLARACVFARVFEAARRPLPPPAARRR